MGSLEVHPQNPRYFATPAGRAVRLTGSHTWAAFQGHAGAFAGRIDLAAIVPCSGLASTGYCLANPPEHKVQCAEAMATKTGQTRADVS
jgi:hypothetical protein